MPVTLIPTKDSADDRDDGRNHGAHSDEKSAVIVNPFNTKKKPTK